MKILLHYENLRKLLIETKNLAERPESSMMIVSIRN